ncbi:hypothetical protein FGG08_005010 [Glutinoglossum americanum]|uniref:GH16 domain-containing protein n=1 Tax=Glutinoglossum americanum TaxID=1670608 RepID=A0A9P8KWG6_9PEZI|nr:hypothetical protein FGG08_005010 [Glutinoglossum americanum]
MSDCECGYSVNATTSQHMVFTDLIETDWLHIKNASLDTDWQPQEFDVSPQNSHGPYGRAARVANVISNPLNDSHSNSGHSVLGGDPGLQLWVRAKPEGNLISTGEIDTMRNDILYGSFRASMKLTGEPGTCGAFFYYFNDTQEIDFEFLSSQFNATSSPVNLVLHSSLSLQDGNDASHSPTFKVMQLPFRPDEGFHEYRFDWTPDKVSFYADGQWLVDMIQDVPTQSGHIAVSQWSNGNELWSGGPPKSDAVMTIQYIKAYFNSSHSNRQADYARRCSNPSAAKAICVVPELSGSPTFDTYFFSENFNQTVNQTVYNDTKKNDAPHPGEGSNRSFWATLVLMAAIIALL